jgi:hypothetical protein
MSNIENVTKKKLGILAIHDKVQLLDKGNNSESYFFEFCPFITF